MPCLRVFASYRAFVGHDHFKWQCCSPPVLEWYSSLLHGLWVYYAAASLEKMAFVHKHEFHVAQLIRVDSSVAVQQKLVVTPMQHGGVE